MKVTQERIVHRHSFEVVHTNSDSSEPLCGYSLLPNNKVTETRTSFISTPWHGRSLHWREEDDILVMKGGGVPYLDRPYVYSGELEGHVWGALPRAEAIQEWTMLGVAQSWGINSPEPVALFKYLFAPPPILLQNFEFFGLIYRVASPYRLVDLEFLGRDGAEVLRRALKDFGYNQDCLHLGVAEWLGQTLSLIRKAGWFHNAVTTHNITLKLEMLDYEASHRLDDPTVSNEMLNSLLHRERIHASEVVFYVSFWLGEEFDTSRVKEVFDKYLKC